MTDVTTETIFATIEQDYDSDVAYFLDNFISYCNERTRFGVPAHHSPLAEVRCEFDNVFCETCDLLQDMSDGAEPALVELQKACGEDSFSVYATRYYYDSYTDDLLPEDWSPHFIVTCPEELIGLCGYVGVNFCSGFFEE